MLYVAEGSSTLPATRALRVAAALRRLQPTVEVRFGSYGLGALYLASRGRRCYAFADDAVTDPRPLPARMAAAIRQFSPHLLLSDSEPWSIVTADLLQVPHVYLTEQPGPIAPLGFGVQPLAVVFLTVPDEASRGVRPSPEGAWGAGAADSPAAQQPPTAYVGPVVPRLPDATLGRRRARRALRVSEDEFLVVAMAGHGLGYYPPDVLFFQRLIEASAMIGVSHRLLLMTSAFEHLLAYAPQEYPHVSVHTQSEDEVLSAICAGDLVVHRGGHDLAWLIAAVGRHALAIPPTGRTPVPGQAAQGRPSLLAGATDSVTAGWTASFDRGADTTLEEQREAERLASVLRRFSGMAPPALDPSIAQWVPGTVRAAAWIRDVLLDAVRAPRRRAAGGVPWVRPSQVAQEEQK